ncbi:T6SS effector phospholipase Tle3 domain-containing protein [Janthinobacterium sp. RB2R34]|uniref:T6SS effector phospholipase Tle3 domain-containing protein n=1 Tax=Janthinobacterium sp. RB2R34 TaxID=3424193 RepID=UPI003F25282A
MSYPKIPYVVARGSALLQCDRAPDQLARVRLRRELPGNVIVIHGVNDVGTSFAAVETGLCEGLDERLYGKREGRSALLRPATYRLPQPADKDTVEPDPDAVFFKRRLVDTTHSPVIPFYWGYRERSNASKVVNGQNTDRHGNRLDKDMSKNGGPFGNATNTLPDMWNKGLYSPVDMGGDPVRPLMTAPGRMYMILAAKRLAALVSMIRDYDSNEVVSIVAHSQGCLISLLAQAFLLDEGKRPADTLILTHPPYSLVEDTSMFFGTIELSRIFGGGVDAAMAGQYDAINDRQTFHARLQTLVQIVQAVVARKHTTPAFGQIEDHVLCHGMTGATWKAEADRDNRGKVYLYFCPEDMTVALDNMQGIGWQGVPDYLDGHGLSTTQGTRQRSIRGDAPTFWDKEHQQRQPLRELGAGFYQRVFTSKRRLDPAKKSIGPVLVGLPPHDFALRLDGEDDHAHVAGTNRGHRARHDEAPWPPVKPHKWNILSTEARRRAGLRTINGEALRVPRAAVLDGGEIITGQFPATSSQATLPPDKQGPCEEVDPIDAAIAITSSDGLRDRRQEIAPDPRPVPGRIPGEGHGLFGSGPHQQVQTAWNLNKQVDEQCKLIRVSRHPGDGDLLYVLREETPNEARRRWQHEVSPKSFHGAIIGNAENHRHVTAYDVAIGGGKASSDPRFYRYLCAVADWRLQKDLRNPVRPSILRWDDFLNTFSIYWNAEPMQRKLIIEGNANYYSNGALPAWLPGLQAGLPSTVVCETLNGQRTESTFPSFSRRAINDIPK